MDNNLIPQAITPAGALPPQPAQPSLQTTNNSSKKWLIFILVAIIIIAAPILGWYFYTKFPPNFAQQPVGTNQPKKRTTVNAYGKTPVAGKDYQKGVILFGLKSGQITTQNQPLTTTPVKPSAVDQKSLPSSVSSIFSKYQVTAISNPLSNTKLNLNAYLLSAPEVTDVLALMTELQKDRNVKFAEPNYYAIPQDYIPNDPYFSSKGSWGQSYDDLWNLKLINMPKAWEITKGDPSVIVGVADSGVDHLNPDLSGNVVEGYGKQAVLLVKKMFTGDCIKTHGTHVAGIIAAKGNDHFGVIGVAPQAKIMPLSPHPCDKIPPDKLLNLTIPTSPSNLEGPIKAIIDFYNQIESRFTVMDYADLFQIGSQDGVKIFNFSSGFPYDSWILNYQISYLVRTQDVTFVTAAGNDKQSTMNSSPSNNSDAIVVSAVDQTDTFVTDYSNFGPTVTVAAPGGDITMNILSTGSTQTDLKSFKFKDTSFDVDDTHIRVSGTSMAAPHVAGLAALVKSLHPDWNSKKIRCAIILGAVQKEGTGFNEKYGYGRIDVLKTLSLKDVTEDCTPIAQITDPVTNSGIDTIAPITITGTASAKDLDSYTLSYLAEGQNPNTGWKQISQDSKPIVNDKLGVWDASSLPDGNYQLRLTVKDKSGRQTIDEIAIYLYGGVVQSSPNPSTESEWKWYIDDQNRFKIQYPASWLSQTGNSTAPSQTQQTGQKIGLFILDKNSSQIGFCTVGVNSSNPNKTLDDWVKEFQASYGTFEEVISSTSETIASQPAHKLVFTSKQQTNVSPALQQAYGNQGKMTVVFIQKDKKAIQLWFEAYKGRDDQMDKIIKHMLDSFQFF